MSTNTEEVTFEELEATDVISVELVPERKGLILKHCEYYVSSRRHGTTVTRRYNEFVQLYDVLYAKYPYRAVCSLPPKRVVVGGGSSLFLQRRRAALQRWLTLVARHPVLAHDADLRTFLCETSPRLEKPKHDEFILAGTQEDDPNEMRTDEMQEAFASEQEELRLTQLGIGRLFKIFEKVESRCSSERADIRELGAALTALAAPAAADSPRWTRMRDSATAAARLATDSLTDDIEDEEPIDRMALALDALSAYRQLCARLTRGLHAERAAAATAPAAPHAPAARALRARHRYALRCAVQEAKTARAYALSALEVLPEVMKAEGTAHARVAALWADLHTALRHPHAKSKRERV
uniref:HM00018 protein n=1 Tax=Heliconius melpomene TaxID=34740 RepID=C9S279_HELME|nr:HM00018 [Heliconius melpomene]